MQRSLFNTDAPTGAYGQRIDPPTTHNNDPSSSREADDNHKASGARATNLALALNLVRRYPDHTADELQGICGYDAPDSPLLVGYELRRRLSDLKMRGDVVTGEPRPSRVAPFAKQQTYRARG